MNKVNKLTLGNADYPKPLRHIPAAPKELFWRGTDPKSWLNKPRVAVVGSRKISRYGQDVTARLVTELARAGVVIISGLAYGVDASAHKAALDAGGITVAVLAGGIDQIYPAAHANLARELMQNGGTLIGEYAPGAVAFKQNFVARNRIVSGLADVVLITEAALTSGSLHTARFGLEQGKTIMAVPGNITSITSEGCNNLIKSGALPVTNAEDIFFALNLKAPPKKAYRAFRGTPDEEKVLGLIRAGMSGQEEIALSAKLDGLTINSVLTMLEISGYIKPVGGGNWTAA